MIDHPQGWDELEEPEDFEDDCREESEEEERQRLIEENCEQCREDAEAYGDEPDCAMCGIMAHEQGAVAPEPGPDDYEPPVPDDDVPF